MRSRRNCLLFISILLFITSGCSTSFPSSVATPAAISLVIPIQTDRFSQTAAIQIHLFNGAQLVLEESNPICLIVHSISANTDLTQCPPGEEYKEVNPEVFSYQSKELGDPIKLTSSTLKLGERYKIIISGLSADGCNTRSTQFTGVADSETILLKDLLWSNTMMPCLKTP